MNEKIIQVKDNVWIHVMQTEKFKTNFIASFILVDLNREEITKNALIPAVLKRGTAKMPTMKVISDAMDDLYGAIFDASSDKIGNKQTLQFYVSCIEDTYALNHEKLLSDSINFMSDLMFHPKLNEGVFDKDYVEQEKLQLLELIKSRINDKASYALCRAVEELFPVDPFGVYKYGREEDIFAINEKNLFEQYQKVMREGEYHFYLVGKIPEETIQMLSGRLVSEIEELQNGQPNSECSHQISIDKADLAKIDTVKQVRDSGDVIQGKIVLAYDAKIDPFSDDLYKVYVYNTILGSSATSKLFQNVREKKSMAYTIRSMFVKHKALMMITAGIEIDKYEKALKYIKAEVEDMRKGNFSKEDIQNAKVFLENVYKTYTDDEVNMVNMSMGQFLLGMRFDIDEMIEKVNQVTKEEIMEVAGKMELKLEYYLGN